jgi:3-oxoacyl-[acyl-carrier-protein] synthase-3
MGSIDTYIVGIGVFLPNAPVNNDEIEEMLGFVNTFSSPTKRRVLALNGIKSRFYAIDPATGLETHTNASMTAEAIRRAAKQAGLTTEELDCVVCGTSSADQLVPSHGSMVHAELGCAACEVATTSGVCCSGMAALKYAHMHVATGSGRHAVATGSELVSVSLRASRFTPEMQLKRTEPDREPKLAFENDFLRWMLSDGAGAVWVTHAPCDGGLSLRIDWIDLLSFASESDTCMYAGMRKQENGSIIGYRSISDPVELCRGGYLSLAQDVRILQNNLPVLMRKAICRVQRKRNLRAEQIEWLLPHYSSESFRQPLYDGLANLGLGIPFSRWFTNLTTKGNTGSASIYIILEELLYSGQVKPGDRILCIVPESARMSFAFVHLTATEA